MTTKKPKVHLKDGSTKLGYEDGVVTHYPDQGQDTGEQCLKKN